MNKKIRIQENKAITLIALVITIIVLIILAGVAINLSFGQNGLFTRAKEARQEYNTAEAKERLEQEILNIQIQAVKEGKEFNLKYLNEKLDKTKYEITLDDEENPTTAVIKEIGSNYYLTVDSKLKVTKVEEKAPKPQHVKFSELTWTSGKASVELSTKEAGTIEYKVGKDGIYQAGTTISNLSNGDIVYVRINNGGTYTEEETKEIKDTIEPEEFTITATDVTYEGVKLTGSTTDNETGIKDYTYVATTGDIIVKEIKNQTATEYTITGLSEGTEYVVYMLAYDNAGNVRKSNEETIETTKMPIANKFGEYIDYPIDLNDDGDTTNDWMIFYIPDGNAEGEEAGGVYENNVGDIYIIAADWLKNTDKRLKITGVNKFGNYDVFWTNPPATLKVTGTEEITVSERNIMNATTTVNKLFMQCKYGSLKSDYANSKCIATFLDTNNWKGYVDSKYADYAIGAPTLEMWVASWNSKYKEIKKVYIKKADWGYNVGIKENPDTYYASLDSVKGYRDNNLYFPIEEKIGQYESNAYWLASPSATSGYSIKAGGILHVTKYGSVHYGIYTNRSKCALRPLVHLKSGTQIQKVDGVWRIQ